MMPDQSACAGKIRKTHSCSFLLIELWVCLAVHPRQKPLAMNSYFNHPVMMFAKPSELVSLLGKICERLEGSFLTVHNTDNINRAPEGFVWTSIEMRFVGEGTIHSEQFKLAP